MLEIKNLQAHIGEKQILKGINLSVKTGEVHAIMGPNGSGKSTLASVLAGREGYDITDGEVMLQGNDILDLSPEERAREGVFLAFQYPVEIPGVNNMYLLKAALNAISVLPNPTSPQISLSIGRPLLISFITSLIAVSWSSVSEKEKPEQNSLYNPSGG